MPHIHAGEGEHDLTVTAYIVRVDQGEPRALLHMHRKLNILLPVGGHVEVSETPWQAIAHELKEEAGYDFHQLQILQPPSRVRKMSKVVQHPYPLSMNTHAITPTHFHTDIEYGFITNEDPLHPIDDGEATDIRWLSGAEIDALPAGAIYDNTREVYHFLLKDALTQWEKEATDSFLSQYPEEYLT